METKSKKKKDADLGRRWFVVDAQGKVLGRLASQVASVLQGKHQVMYTPHIDVGDFVIVVNAAGVVLTGSKEDKKMYHRHTTWVGGVRSRTAAQQRAHKPEDMIKWAIKGMLPKGTLGRNMASKLKVYAAGEHPHSAQQPEPLAV